MPGGSPSCRCSASALGGGALYLPVVALKEIAAEFGDRRAVPSMAYMLGFFAMGVGGVFMGWLADRTSPRVPLLIAGVSIFAGGWLAAQRRRDGRSMLGYAMPLGFLGNAATFTPAMNNIQGWFDKPAQHRRVDHLGRTGDLGLRLAAGLSLAAARRRLAPVAGDLRRGGRHAAVPLRLLRAALADPAPRQGKRAPEDLSALPMPSSSLMALLSAAGFCCCAAMAVPFVHMVAFCGDLGLSPARGSEAISLILLTAVAATFAMGRLSDHIGPLKVSLLCVG